MSNFGLITSAILGGATAARFYQHKQDENTRKNLIGEAYGLASKQLGYRQQNVREDEAESLGARGMTGGGQATNTVAGQTQANTEGQLGLERQDLDFQRREQLAGVKADYANQTLGDVVGTASAAGNVYSAGSMIRGAFGLPANNGGLPALRQVSGSVGEPGMPNYDFNVG